MLISYPRACPASCVLVSCSLCMLVGLTLAVDARSARLVLYTCTLHMVSSRLYDPPIVAYTLYSDSVNVTKAS